MIGVKIITVGTLKEGYLREAEAEYAKRLSGFCRLTEVSLKEERLPDTPSDSEIKIALRKEGEAILAQIPRRAFKIALCVEGKQLSSEELAQKLLEGAVNRSQGNVRDDMTVAVVKAVKR